MAILLKKVRKVAGASRDTKQSMLESMNFLAAEVRETNARITDLASSTKDRSTSLANVSTEELRKELRNRLDLVRSLLHW